MRTQQTLHSVVENSLRKLALDRTSEAAWREFFEVIWPVMFAVAYRNLGGSTPTAAEICQDAFTRAFFDEEFPVRITSPSHCIAYARRLVRNGCVDHWRQQAARPHRPLEAEDRIFAKDNASDRVHEAELAREIKSAVRALSLDDQRLLEMMISERPRDEIARELGQSYGGVVMRIHRIRGTLRNSLQDKGLL